MSPSWARFRPRRWRTEPRRRGPRVRRSGLWISDEVDGQHVERIAATITPGTSARVVGFDGGLQILAVCSGGGELLLQAGSTTEHALVRASVISALAPAPPNVAIVDDADLNAGEQLTLFDTHGRGTAHVTYFGTDGRVSTALIGFGELTGPQSCTVAGTLVRLGELSAARAQRPRRGFSLGPTLVRVQFTSGPAAASVSAIRAPQARVLIHFATGTRL